MPNVFLKYVITYSASKIGIKRLKPHLGSPGCAARDHDEALLGIVTVTREFLLS